MQKNKLGGRWGDFGLENQGGFLVNTKNVVPEYTGNLSGNIERRIQWIPEYNFEKILVCVFKCIQVKYIPKFPPFLLKLLCIQVEFFYLCSIQVFRCSDIQLFKKTMETPIISKIRKSIKFFEIPSKYSKIRICVFR